MLLSLQQLPLKHRRRSPPISCPSPYLAKTNTRLPPPSPLAPALLQPFAEQRTPASRAAAAPRRGPGCRTGPAVVLPSRMEPGRAGVASGPGRSHASPQHPPQG